MGLRLPDRVPGSPPTAPLPAHSRSERMPGARQRRAPSHQQMKPRFPHLPPMPAPGNFAPHSSGHVPTRTPTALHPAARPSLSHHRCPAWLPRSPLALVTTAKLLAGCRAPVLNAPTMLLVVGLEVAVLHPLQV